MTFYTQYVTSLTKTFPVIFTVNYKSQIFFFAAARSFYFKSDSQIVSHFLEDGNFVITVAFSLNYPSLEFRNNLCLIDKLQICKITFWYNIWLKMAKIEEMSVYH